jgi:hypothetical protein
MLEVHVYIDQDKQGSIDASPSRVSNSRKFPERKFYSSVEDLLLDTWWSKNMFRCFQEGLLTWQTYNGAVEAARSGQAVEIDSAEMVYGESKLKLLRAFKVARGNHLQTQKVVQKMLAEGLRIGKLRSIDENVIKSYTADTVDVLQEAWGGERSLSNKKKEELKSEMFQSRFEIEI